MHTRSISEPTKKAKNKEFNAKNHQTPSKNQTVQHINQKLTKQDFFIRIHVHANGRSIL